MESYYDFTYDKDLFAELPGFVDELHNVGMKFVIILVSRHERLAKIENRYMGKESV